MSKIEKMPTMTLLVCHLTQPGQKRPLWRFLSSGFPPSGSSEASQEGPAAMGLREHQKVAREHSCNCWMPQRLRKSNTISYDFQRAQRAGGRVTKNGPVCHLYHLGSLSLF